MNTCVGLWRQVAATSKILYDPNGYRYSLPIPDLPDGNNHLVVCVRFRWRTLPNGILHEEKFVTTAYFQFF